MQGSLLCSLLVVAANAESSQLQEATKPLAGLLESAKGLLANGATNDTVAFVEATLEKVKQDIIPAIRSESLADKDWMDTEWKKFQTEKDGFENNFLTSWSTVSIDLSGLAKMYSSCRSKERHKSCEAKVVCEKQLYENWETWKTAEDDLTGLHGAFFGHFCTGVPFGANDTLAKFRDGVLEPMQSWRLKKKECDLAEIAYTGKVLVCEIANDNLDAQSATCNTIQEKLEKKACSSAKTYHEAVTNFQSTWNSYISSYQGITDLVYQQTQDRRQEYRTLKVVTCLLKEIHAMNGRPCDENGEFDKKLSTCEQEEEDFVKQGLDCTILTKDDICPDYDHPPDAPTIPEPIAMPCESEWKQLLGALPAPPSPDFSATNPGCNVYPDCTSCDAKEVGEWKALVWLHPDDSFGKGNAEGADHATFGKAATEYASEDGNGLRAVTADGCLKNEPTVTRKETYKDDTAAVRCCSAALCFTPGQTDNTCEVYQDMTFHDAKYYCDKKLMRLCTEAELDSGKCCNTGCGFDGRSVWTSE